MLFGFFVDVIKYEILHSLRIEVYYFVIIVNFMGITIIVFYLFIFTFVTKTNTVFHLAVNKLI